MDNEKNDPTAMEEPKYIEFDYLVENIQDDDKFYLARIVDFYLSSHGVHLKEDDDLFHFTVKLDKFLAQQLLEIITAYVESHYLQMAGGFHVQAS
jgi:uncharacterized iron-regulated protein